jgi:hypothetical protein
MDFETIEKAIQSEPYLKRAINRFVEMIWKNGYSFVGDNKEAIDYINRRLDEMAFISGVPTITLFEDITRELISYGNVFVQKMRSTKSSTGKSVTLFEKILQPIAMLRILKTRNVAIVADNTEDIAKYIYKTPNYLGDRFKNKFGIVNYNFSYLKYEEELLSIPTEDIVHFYSEKSAGEYFGNPHILGVLDDVKCLRRMEESVESLVFQHSIPMLHVIVGDEKTGSTASEVNEAATLFANMLSEGMVATSHRYKIESVSTKQATLDVIPYLEYFKLRILTGMGQSLISIGESGQSSRATAQVLNEAVIGMAKRYQRIICEFIEQYIINEILAEGGYKTFITKNKIDLYIPELDDDRKTKFDNVTIQLYSAGIITIDEARIRLGIPTLPMSERKNLYPYIQSELTIKQQTQAEAAKAAQQTNPQNQTTKRAGGATPAKKIRSSADICENLATKLDDYFLNNNRFDRDNLVNLLSSEISDFKEVKEFVVDFVDNLISEYDDLIQLKTKDIKINKFLTDKEYLFCSELETVLHKVDIY